MMNAIFSSKLYKGSTRKDRIHAALLSPANDGLIQQLAEDLDEEYQTPEYLGTEDQLGEGSQESSKSLIVDEEIDPSKDLMKVSDLGGRSSSFGGGKPLGPKPDPSDSDSESSDLDLPDLPEEEKPSEDIASEPSVEETEASTKIQSCDQVNLTVLKDSLNGREDTCGVSRIAEKENEIWIYYKDEVNLNNLMTEVIEYMMNAGYITLEFNRLARSDNAIVFQKIESTIPDAGTVEPLEEGEKKE